MRASSLAVLDPRISGGEAWRWFFWYVRRPGEKSWTIIQPQWLSDSQAFHTEFQTKSRYLGTEMYRLIYDPKVAPHWVFDPRNDRDFLAGRPIPRVYS